MYITFKKIYLLSFKVVAKLTHETPKDEVLHTILVISLQSD